MAGTDRKRILVVDKNPNTLYAFRLFFEKEGYDIYETHSVNKGLSMACSTDYLAAFIDLSPPQMIQPELVAKMEDLAQTLTFIIMTSHLTEYSHSIVQQIGALDLLEKPISIIKLREILNKITI